MFLWLRHVEPAEVPVSGNLDEKTSKTQIGIYLSVRKFFIFTEHLPEGPVAWPDFVPGFPLAAAPSFCRKKDKKLNKNNAGVIFMDHETGWLSPNETKY